MSNLTTFYIIKCGARVFTFVLFVFPKRFFFHLRPLCFSLYLTSLFAFEAHRVGFAHNTYLLYFFDKIHDVMR